MNVLVVDVGTTIKVLAPEHRPAIRIRCGPHLTARCMVRLVREAVDSWACAARPIGYSGPVRTQP
jgi:hypothetical protein